jgi:N,N'-diacetyllegionaminate synthase
LPTWFEALRSGARRDLRCLVIGEVAQAHDGSVGLAHAFVDAIADAGADAVKFQTHIAAAESTDREPWRVRFSQQDVTRRDYWRRMEFTAEQWQGLKDHATARGLAFLSSPFSLEALELLMRVGVPAWKIASGEVGTGPLLDRAIATGLPVLMSTGLSPLSEIDRLVDQLRAHDTPFAVLQCTTAYPCPPERVGLNLITELSSRYGAVTGLSDHSGTIYPALAAVTLGAQVVEVHVTLSRQMFGPDVVASVTSAELRQMVEGIRFIERMRAHPIDKNAAASEVQGLRAAFTKSIVAGMDLAAGTVLRPEHLALKKPGTGLPASELSSLVGMRLHRSVALDEPLRHVDVESTQS